MSIDKAGRNGSPSQITERPSSPSTMSNDPPDVVLELTHEQATFLLENCDANLRLGFAMILSLADDESIALEVLQARSEVIENMRKRFAEMRKLLRRAGAREKEE